MKLQGYGGGGYQQQGYGGGGGYPPQQGGYGGEFSCFLELPVEAETNLPITHRQLPKLKLQAVVAAAMAAVDTVEAATGATKKRSRCAFSGSDRAPIGPVSALSRSRRPHTSSDVRPFHARIHPE